MKMINVKTGQRAKITINEFGFPEYQEAADRLMSRQYKWHFASSLSFYDLENRPKTNIELHPCRSVGDLTEVSSKTVLFQIV